MRSRVEIKSQRCQCRSHDGAQVQRDKREKNLIRLHVHHDCTLVLSPVGVGFKMELITIFTDYAPAAAARKNSSLFRSELLVKGGQVKVNVTIT